MFIYRLWGTKNGYSIASLLVKKNKKLFLNRRPCMLLFNYTQPPSPVVWSGQEQSNSRLILAVVIEPDSNRDRIPPPSPCARSQWTLTVSPSDTKVTKPRVSVACCHSARCWVHVRGWCSCYLLTDPVLILSSCAWTPHTGVRLAYRSVLRQVCESVWERDKHKIRGGHEVAWRTFPRFFRLVLYSVTHSLTHSPRVREGGVSFFFSVVNPTTFFVLA